MEERIQRLETGQAGVNPEKDETTVDAGLAQWLGNIDELLSQHQSEIKAITHESEAKDLKIETLR